MFKFKSIADERMERSQQIKDLNFDWTRNDSKTLDKIQEYADSIYEKVVEEVDAQNPINYLFDVKPGELGKKITWKKTFGGRVYQRTYGEYKKASPIKSRYFTMTTSPKSVHLFWPVESLKAGTVLTSEIIQMARDAILHYRVKLAWDTLVDAIGSNSAYYTNIGTDYTFAEIEPDLNSLSDSCPVQAIIGRRSFLGQIITMTGYDGSTGFPESVKDQLHSMGFVGQLAGVPVIAINSYQDELSGAEAIDDDNIFLIGSKAKTWNRFAEVSPITPSQKVVLEDGTWHLFFDFEDGFTVWDPKFMRRLHNGT